MTNSIEIGTVAAIMATIAPVIGKFETIYVALQTILSFFQGPTLAILLLGILWRRATRWGEVAQVCARAMVRR